MLHNKLQKLHKENQCSEYQVVKKGEKRSSRSLYLNLPSKLGHFEFDLNDDHPLDYRQKINNIFLPT